MAAQLGEVILVLALAAAPATDAPRATTLKTSLRGIETAFRRGDAAALSAAATRAARVRVEIRGLRGARGSYAAGQLKMVLGRMFRDHETREFSFGERTDPVDSETRAAFARGRWVSRKRPEGPEKTRHLTFTLRHENRTWRIHEILSSN